MGRLKESAAELCPTPTVPFQIHNAAGQESFGVIIQQASDPNSGNVLILLNNISQARRIIELSPSPNRTPNFINLITQQPCRERIELQPNQLVLISHL